MDINLSYVPVMWLENEEGDRISLPPDPSSQSFMSLSEKGFIFGHTQFPTQLRHDVSMTILPEKVESCSHPAEWIVRTEGWGKGIKGRKCTRCGGTQITREGREWPEKWEAKGSRLLVGSNASWPEDLVLAMATQECPSLGLRKFKLGEAIRICGNACKRCLNVLEYHYLNDPDPKSIPTRGYLEYSEQWKSAGTTCCFCKGRSGKNHVQKEEGSSPHERG